MYDYLIVGAGLFGSVFAQQMSEKGYKCLVIDKKTHIGGHIYTKKIEGIDVHIYGAHIFHTSNEKVWQYVNRFVKFNNFVNSPMAIYKNEIYNLPFNMNTFSKMWGIKTPDEAKKIISDQIIKSCIDEPSNLEEQAIKLVGYDIYEKLIRGYTKKQWGIDPRNLPSFIIKRLPVRFTYDNNYFKDIYQGIPTNGYTEMIELMLNNVEVRLNTDFFDNRDYFMSIAKKVIYTGPIDRFFNYSLGTLEYRSLRFETDVLNTDNFQGNAVINYTEEEVPFTRIIEHKHFNFGNQSKTVVTKEYSQKWEKDLDPYYPINDQKNNDLYLAYNRIKCSEENVIFGGRLGEYKYYDMHQVIEKALQLSESELKKSGIVT